MIKSHKFKSKSKPPLGLRLKYWWWRRQQSPELLELLDRIDEEATRQMLFGKGSRGLG